MTANKVWTKHKRLLGLLPSVVALIFIATGTLVGLWQTYHLSSSHIVSNNASSWSGRFTYERPSIGIPMEDNRSLSTTDTNDALVNSVPSTQTPKTTTSTTVKSTPTATMPSLPSSTTPVSVPDVCSTRIIQFNRRTEYLSYINKGYSYTIPGITGTEYYCTNSSGYKKITATIPAFDEVTYIGTAEPFQFPAITPLPTSSSTPTTHEQYLNLIQQCLQLPGNTSAPEACVRAVNASGVR